MTYTILLSLVLSLFVPTPLALFPTPQAVSKSIIFTKTEPTTVELSSREMSMDYRYPVPSVSEVFKANILLNIAYLDGRVTDSKGIDWNKVTSASHTEFTLKPNEVFAYHNRVLPQYAGKVTVTTNSRFNKQDGYKSDGYLYGDGVCQLASLINWAAKDAKLEVYAPANHDFAKIPEVPKEFGVAIYFDPNNPSHSASRNLYITNNQDKPITFRLDYDGGKLKISVIKIA